MGTWLATVRFPGGGIRYAQYSTVVGAVLEGLFTEASLAYGRRSVTGEREKPDPSAPAGPVLVEIETEPDGDRWHALYRPDRAAIAGPVSDHHRHRLREQFEQVRDDHGRRHLCRDGGEQAACGRRVTGTPLGFQRPWTGWGEPATEPAEPAADLYAEWDEPDVCRPCLLACVEAVQ